ncbi:MAG: AMP-dependent synthetase and ligase [Variovorax sp.]|nr:AMP-dependent synthetase and ligase [Variovorax sp.]
MPTLQPRNGDSRSASPERSFDHIRTNPMLFSGFGDPTRWVLPAVLAEQARRQPESTWIETTEGERYSFGEAWHDARKVAGWFAAHGVAPGDRVALVLGNHLDFVRAWLGLGVLGATAVFLNSELHGAFLSHQLRNCGAALAVVDGTVVASVDAAAMDVETLKRITVCRSTSVHTGRLPQLDWETWRLAAPYDGPLPRAQDIACVMYTSGTSGPAKGVLMPHAHCTLYGIGTIASLQLNAADRYYISLPLFHANGLLMQLGATLLTGIPAIVRPKFSASQWLSDIRQHGATVTNLLGAASAFIFAQPADAADRDHRLRVVCCAPNPAVHEAVFHERFGVADVISGFGMTEVNIPVHGRIGQPRPGAAGWVDSDWFEVVVADPETDAQMPHGQRGEILVRPKVPFGFMAGYLDMPDRTVEAWRNLWFHTGDAGVMEEDGLLWFVDRIKDCIRRRGENISATEIELLITDFPGVQEVVAYAMPSSIVGGEDEVMLAVVPQPDTLLDIAALIAHADAVLPRHAQPRFVRLVSELPKTATGKVQRAVLRKGGVESAWDREQALPSGSR